MDAQDFRSLQEAYMEVVENQQQLDEANRGDEYVTSSMYMSREPETTAAKVRRRQKRDGLPDNASHTGDDKDYDRQWAHKVERGRKKLKPYSSQTLEGEKNPTGKYAAMQRRKRQGLSYREEQVDIYDIILSHLLDEGYAETPEAAEEIMVNMSEDWRDEIIDESYVDYRKGRLPSGRTPQTALKSGVERAKVNASREQHAGGSFGTTATPSWKRAKKAHTVGLEMDAHTGLGGKINKALSPGLGNRPGAGPRVAYGEPNTDRHQWARSRRGQSSTKD